LEYQQLQFAVDGGVAVITLHRPEARNAFTVRMGREISDAYRYCDGADDVRAVVITGTPPAFCAGADMSGGGDTFAKRDESKFTASPVMPAWDVRKPVIAAMNGHALGIGFTMAMQCDLRIAAADAKYGVVQVRRGVIPDAAAHWSVPRIAGWANAAEILLTGKMFDGREAKELGVVNRVLPNDDVLPAALAMAHDIAANAAPLSVAMTKRLLWEALDRSADEVAELETALHHVVMGKPDAKEGVVAFLEKRAPNWVGSVSREWPKEPPQ